MYFVGYHVAISSPTSSEKGFAVNLMEEVLTVISKLNSMFLVLGTSCTILW